LLLNGATVIVSLRSAETGQIVATGAELLRDEIPADTGAAYEACVDVEPNLDLSALEYDIVVKGELP
jgi:hypothetical protein